MLKYLILICILNSEDDAFVLSAAVAVEENLV
jgi:hypothetical protein